MAFPSFRLGSALVVKRQWKLAWDEGIFAVSRIFGLLTSVFSYAFFQCPTPPPLAREAISSSGTSSSSNHQRLHHITPPAEIKRPLLKNPFLASDKRHSSLNPQPF